MIAAAWAGEDTAGAMVKATTVDVSFWVLLFHPLPFPLPGGFVVSDAVGVVCDASLGTGAPLPNVNNF